MKQVQNAIKKFFISMFWAIEQSQRARAQREVDNYISFHARTLEDVERLHKQLEKVGK